MALAWVLGLALLAAPLAARAAQIAPNPNPSGTTITVSGADENDVFFTNNGTLAIVSPGTLTNTDRLESYGTLSIGAGGLLTNTSTWGQLWNYGVLTNTGDLVNSASATLNNEATLVNSGAFSNSAEINNDGTLTNSGTFSNHINGEVYNNDTFNNTGTLLNEDWFANSGTLNNSGTITSSGWLSNASWGTWNNTGTLTTSNVVYNYFHGTWTNDTAASVANSGDIYNWGDFINNGTLTNTGTFHNSAFFGTFTNTGTLNNSGTFLNDGVFSDSGIFVNDGGTIENNGTMSIASLVLHSGSTGAITGTTSASVTTADVGGTLDFTGSGGLSVTSLNLAGGTFANNGSGAVAIGTVAVASGSTGTISGTGDTELTTADVGGTLTVSAPLTGAGSLTKTGAGLLRLSGTNTYTGATFINAGSLIVDGSIASPVTMNAGGTLKGSGSITGNVSNFGTLAPGNSIGTLTVSGNYTHNPGAVYEAEVNAAGQSDLLIVTGTATLNGGTVSVLAAPGTYNATTNYTLLTATGGVIGSFAGVTSNLAFLTPTLSYDANNVFLALDRNSNFFADVAVTDNQCAVGSALDRGFASASGDMTTVYNNLLTLSAAGARHAYDQMGGLTHVALAEVSSFALDNYLGILANRLRERAAPSLAAQEPLLAFLARTVNGSTVTSGRDFWMTGYGSTGDRTGNDAASRYGYDASGVAWGYDQRLGRDFLLGASAGYTSTSIDMNDLDDDAEVSLCHASLYGSYAPGPWYVNGLAVYAYSHYDSTRRIAFGGLSRVADASYDGHTFLGQAEAGYLVEVQTVRVTPFAALEAAYQTRDAFTERGAGALNLATEGAHSTTLTSSLGLAAEKTYDTSRGDLTPRASLAWRHQLLDTDQSLSASFAGSPVSAFTVRTEDSGRDSAVAGLGLSWAVREDLALAASYEGTIASAQVQHLGSLLLNYSW